MEIPNNNQAPSGAAFSEHRSDSTTETCHAQTMPLLTELEVFFDHVLQICRTCGAAEESGGLHLP
jgi:hypothetical protein